MTREGNNEEIKKGRKPKKRTKKSNKWRDEEKERAEGRQAYLSEEHHVLHDKGDVEQRGEAVEEVELWGKEWRQR